MQNNVFPTVFYMWNCANNYNTTLGHNMFLILQTVFTNWERRLAVNLKAHLQLRCLTDCLSRLPRQWNLILCRLLLTANRYRHIHCMQSSQNSAVWSYRDRVFRLCPEFSGQSLDFPPSSQNPVHRLCLSLIPISEPTRPY